jgi:hypothetical protein
MRDEAVIALPAEPFVIVPWEASDGQDYAIVGHMVGGEVSLLEIRSDGVALVDVSEDFVGGTNGLAVDDYGRFLASSRSEAQLTAFRISGPHDFEPDEGATIEPALTLIRTIDVDLLSDGDDQRGVALSPDGSRAYVVSRQPESVFVLEMTEDGRDYEYQFLDVIEVGEGPAIIESLSDERFPAGFLLYVVCFDADRIYVIDPSIDEVVDIVATRRGPHDLVFDPASGVGYLANFLESTLSILDVDPESPRYHSILTTLGQPRRPRTND